MLIEQIKSDRIKAMKTKDKFLKDFLSILLSEAKALTTMDKSKPDYRENFDDETMVVMIKKQLKAIKAFEDKYGDDELNNQRKEILENYLPEQLTEQEIHDKILIVIETEGIERSMKSMGILMRILKEEFGSDADMGLVSKLVKEELNR